MLQPNLEYNPKKKNRVLKIIAQIVSTLFTAFMLVAVIGIVIDDDPEWIPFEKVNLYNTNYNDVYELKDLKVVSKYATDEDFDYYLVFLPYQDEMVKAASFRCPKHYYDTYSEDNQNSIIGKSINAGVTADTTGVLYDNIEAAYNNAVTALKESGMQVMSTELSFDFVCEPNKDAFDAYFDEEKSADVIAIVFSVAFSLLGIILMIISFKNSNYNPEQTYFVPGSHKTSLDFDFDKRF